MRARILLSTLLLLASARAQTLDRIVAAAAQPGQPGVVVGVRRDGRLVAMAGRGVRDLQSKVPLDAQTDLRLASCTKQFTAMAIMLLVHDHKLRYDTRLTDVFPDFPEYGKQITVRHILNHTSGLPDYESLMDDGQYSPQHQISDAEVLALLKQTTTPRFAAGTHWSYSNSGYVVLGLVVAKIAGMTFPQFLAQRIFEPLHMDHTLAYVRGVNTVPNRAFGHSLEDGKLIQTDQSSTSATLGDGGVYSTLEDLAKWDAALAQHTLLSEKEMQAALTPVKLNDGSQPHWDSGPGDTDPNAGKPLSYGFGWFLDPYKGHARMWHYGDTRGFKAAIMRFPKEKVTVIVLANRSDIDAIELAEQAAAQYLPKP